MTDDSAFKKQVRARMAATGENYTTARRLVIAERNPGQPPVALRAYLSPYVDLELTDDEVRAYTAAGEDGQREMASRLLAGHLREVGVEGAGAAAGSELLTIQEQLIDQITDVIHSRLGRAAGIRTIAVSGGP